MPDPLMTTATELRERLEDGKISSVQIVQEYLAYIDRYNSKLNTFISIAPRDEVIRVAAALDQERRCGRIKSPLHGIPIVFKDCFVTDSGLGMSTTAGAWAFKSAKATHNGHIVQKLIDAGLIKLGKTNMTELCGVKLWITPGRSAITGQTLSVPYVLGYPLSAVPLGQLKYNKRPLGLCIMAKANQEEKLLRFQTIYESAVAARPVPEFE